MVALVLIIIVLFHKKKLFTYINPLTSISDNALTSAKSKNAVQFSIAWVLQHTLFRVFTTSIAALITSSNHYHYFHINYWTHKRDAVLEYL